MAVEVDARARRDRIVRNSVLHVHKIRLQNAGFCDQSVNEPAHYQDLHLCRRAAGVMRVRV